MNAPSLRLLFALLLFVTAMTARPAAAQTILRDAETEAFFADISAPLIEAAGMRPDNVEFVLIQDPNINAFVAGGQRVYIHSGLITASDHVGQVQGVVAHELGHVAGGHIIRLQDGIQDAGIIQIASLVLGGLAMAAGAGEAGMGAMALGQQVAVSRFLSHSRTQESSADMAGATYLAEAGLSGRGSVEFFQKLQNQEYRLNIPQDNGYARTHPMTRDRISTLQDVYQRDDAWDTAVDPELNERFLRVKAKLIGYLNPERAARDYPDGERSAPALTARAYAYHKGGYPNEALAYSRALVEMLPDDPYALELHGQILLESGNAQEALAPLRKAAQLVPDEPLVATTFGHALMATEDPTNFDEARTVLRAATGLDRTNPFAWYQLGTLYTREGDEARAALASAERFSILRQHKQAYANARFAMSGIAQGTPDWVRAQDVALVSEQALRDAGEEVR